MIYLGNVYEVDPKQYDEVWVIARKVDSLGAYFQEYPNAIHVPELSPSEELFCAYRKRFHEGSWNRVAFLSWYRPRFMEEMKEGSEGYEKMVRLAEYAVTRRIMLVCFCEDETICHRSIVGELLNIMGAEIYRKSTETEGAGG